MKNNCIVFKLSPNLKDKFIKFYEPFMSLTKPPYSVFQARNIDVVITLYESGKAMFQGPGADIESMPWIALEKKLNNNIIDVSKKEKPKKEENEFFFYSSTIGSDEAGCGDFFGPVVVCATYVSKENISKLKALGVKDSKKLTDTQIKEIAVQLTKMIPYSCQILDNETYNKNSSDVNMVKLKCILHNKVLCNLIENNNFTYEHAVIDQFVNEKKYYEYLKGIPKVLRNIKFYTKGESKCMAIAAASIIARYVFLTQMDKISAELGFEVHKGASSKVDEQINKLINEQGPEILNKYAKLNFNNYLKIIHKNQ